MFFNDCWFTTICAENDVINQICITHNVCFYFFWGVGGRLRRRHGWRFLPPPVPSALGATQMFALWAKCTPYSASASPQFLRQWGYPDVRPLGEIIEGGVFRATSSRRSSGMLLIRWGLVGVEPVGGGAVAGGEAHATVVGILHLGNDDVLHLRQFARHHVEVQLVVYLQNHA